MFANYCNYAISIHGHPMYTPVLWSTDVDIYEPMNADAMAHDNLLKRWLSEHIDW